MVLGDALSKLETFVWILKIPLPRLQAIGYCARCDDKKRSLGKLNSI